jgi:16S rRNA processing protein RimM
MAGRKICVGEITGVHGVRGLVRLKSFTDPPTGLAHYPTVFDERGTSYGIAIQSSVKGQFLARIDGIADRTTAETLKGTKLYVDRMALPEIDNGRYYHADLIGLDVINEDGAKIGILAAIHDFGAGDILEVQGCEGCPDFMVPFVPAFVPEVDVTNGRMVIAPFEVVE